MSTVLLFSELLLLKASNHASHTYLREDLDGLAEQRRARDEHSTLSTPHHVSHMHRALCQPALEHVALIANHDTVPPQLYCVQLLHQVVRRDTHVGLQKQNCRQQQQTR